MQPTQFVTSGDVRLAVYSWGKRPTKQQPRSALVLIHGYPDRAEVWSAVAEQLAERFYVIAYDVRGAGRSTVPAGSAAYAFKHLSADLRAVIDAMSPKQPVHLVGHDWGALQGWDALLSGVLDGRVASWSTAAPHLDHLGHWIREKLGNPTPMNLAQAVRRVLGSSYMLMFKIPGLPELTWKLGLGRIWPRLLSAIEGVKLDARPGQTDDAVGSLGLYRANLLPPLLRPQTRSTPVPVQLLVMKRDPFVPAPLFAGLESTAPNLHRSEFDASHWGLLSQPTAIAESIAMFVTTVEGA